MPKTNNKKKDETKREKFTRLGQYRVAKLLKNMESLGKLSNSTIYEFTDADVTAMNTVVSEKWNVILAAFAGKAEKKEEFTF